MVLNVIKLSFICTVLCLCTYECIHSEILIHSNNTDDGSRVLKIKDSDCIYDLGSGVGKVVDEL